MPRAASGCRAVVSPIRTGLWEEVRCRAPAREWQPASPAFCPSSPVGISPHPQGGVRLPHLQAPVAGVVRTTSLRVLTSAAYTSASSDVVPRPRQSRSTRSSGSSQARSPRQLPVQPGRLDALRSLPMLVARQPGPECSPRGWLSGQRRVLARGWETCDIPWLPVPRARGGSPAPSACGSRSGPFCKFPNPRRSGQGRSGHAGDPPAGEGDRRAARRRVSQAWRGALWPRPPGASTTPEPLSGSTLGPPGPAAPPARPTLSVHAQGPGAAQSARLPPATPLAAAPNAAWSSKQSPEVRREPARGSDEPASQLASAPRPPRVWLRSPTPSARREPPLLKGQCAPCAQT